MARIKDDITLKVQNNLRYDANIGVLGGVQDPTNNNANAFTLYEWDLTAETFVGVTTVQIFAFPISTGLITVYTKKVGSVTSIAQTVEILNSFNIGLFNYSGKIIFTTNDVFGYDKLAFT